MNLKNSKQKQSALKKEDRMGIKNGGRPSRRMIFFSIIIILVTCISLIFNFDRFLDSVPQRYRYLFERMNDFIFGKIQIIEITGNRLLSKTEILSHIYKKDVSKDDLIIINSMYNIQKSLTEHPLLENVNIKRFLPNRMVLYVKEKEVILKFYNKEQDKFQSVTKDGTILNFSTSTLKVPLLIGDFSLPNVLSFYRWLSKNKNANAILQEITAISSFFDYRFDVILNNKTLVSLPEKKLDFALDNLADLMMNHKILQKPIKHIDLRVNGKIFIEYFGENDIMRYKPLENMKIIEFLQ